MPNRGCWRRQAFGLRNGASLLLLRACGGEIGEEISRPTELGCAEKMSGEVGGAVLRQKRIDPCLRVGIGSAAQRERDRAEPEFEQTLAASGLEGVMPLRRRAADQFNLPIITPATNIDQIGRAHVSTSVTNAHLVCR